MKKSLLFLPFLFTTLIVFGQKLTTTSATVVFDATTPKDALVKAENKTVIGSLDKTTGNLAFEAAVNNFAFSNPMLQDHFNGANWMNSASYPKFSFTGKINKLSEVKFNKNGSYDVKITGNLTVKGITKPVTVPAKIIVKNGAVKASSSFSISLDDYGISGQPINEGKIAKQPKVSVNASF
jgi:polyisoprenoid-binding protein YceI